jgi:hypothetical protein
MHPEHFHITSSPRNLHKITAKGGVQCKKRIESNVKGRDNAAKCGDESLDTLKTRHFMKTNFSKKQT